MEPLGIIQNAGGESELDCDAWLTAASADPRLSQVAPVEGVNPFTRKPTMYERPHAMDVTIDGQALGTMVWEAGVIHVSGAEELKVVAAEIAAALGAAFHPLDAMD